MADTRQIRRRLHHVLTGLGILCVVCLAVILSPIGQAARTGPERVAALQSQLAAKQAEVRPLDGISEKIVEAKQQIAGFYDRRLPTSYADISESLGKLAAESGVRLGSTRYSTEQLDFDNIRQVTVTSTVSGSYSNAVRFINSLERSKTFFLVNSVSLGSSNTGSAELQITAEAYLRAPTAADAQNPAKETAAEPEGGTKRSGK